MVLITTVTGAYKPTYNEGAHIVPIIRHIHVDPIPKGWAQEQFRWPNEEAPRLANSVDVLCVFLNV